MNYSRGMQRERDEMYVVVTSLPKEPHNHECTINDYQYVALQSGILTQKISLSHLEHKQE